MFKNNQYIFGAGGGGDAPDRVDDNLFSEDIVEFALAVSEGPIRGLTRGAKTFYVGDTQLVSDNDDLNFRKFAVGVYPGYSEESSKFIQQKLGGTTSNTTVNVSLQQSTPVTRQTSAVLRNLIDEIDIRIYFQRLMYASDGGDTDYENAVFDIEYKKVSDSIWLKHTGNTITIRGKTTSGYAKDFTIPVPRINEDWMLRVTKHSIDNSETNIIDLSWESFQLTTKGQVKYPYVAVLHGLGVADGQFSSIPEFSGVFDGMLVRVPTNYNPDLRTYDELTPWDGSFKFAWTNNNAWVLYHLLVDTRCGLAAHYPHIDVNRFDFYEAAKWCDTPTTAGSGTQPRFTFNAVLNEPRNALEMLSYVAGSFNALIYDDMSGRIHLRVDRDDPASQLFTPENVSTEGFNYTYTDISTRVNDISVAFVNPDLDWNEDRRRITGVTTDEAAIAKHGRIPLDFIAVGCTNEYEAIRRAQYRLISSQTEKTTVNFITTRIGVLTRLYDVILIADPTMGWSQTGRIKSYDSSYIYLRDPIFIETNEPYILKIQTISGIQEITVLVEAIGYVDRFVLGEPMPVDVPEQTVFSLEQAGGLGLAKPFRVLSVEPVEGSPHQFSVSAIEINRAKYPIGDAVATIPEFRYSYKQPTLPNEPTNLFPVSGSLYTIANPTGEIIDRIFFSWKDASLASPVTGYEVRWRLNTESEWQVQTVLGNSVYLSPVIQGLEYDLQVRSLMATTKSRWVSTTHTVLTRSIKPVVPFNLLAFGGLFKNKLDWEFGASYDYKYVEIWGGPTSNTATFSKLTEVVYPQSDWEHLGLGVGQIFHYRVRALSKTNVYSDWTSVVSATTSSVPGPILSILNNQISSSQLVPELAAEIDSLADTNLAVIQQGTKIDGLNAQYTVKIQANGYVSGYGLATTPVDGVPTSSFVVLADNFAFAIPGSVVRYPFVAGLVNGASTVGVNGALVVDGTITASAINTNGLVIRSSTGVPLFGAGTNLDISYIQGLGGFATLNQITDVNSLTYIASGAIANAQIGSFLMSSDFNGDPSTNTPGTLGWYLGKSGSDTGKLYLNNIYARGNIEADSLKANTANIVQTLHVAGNAITARMPAYTVGGITLSSSSYAEVQRASITTVSYAGTSSQVTVSCGFFLALGGGLRGLRIYRNGTLVMQETGEPGAFDKGCYTFVFVDSPTPGTWTYTMEVMAFKSGTGSSTTNAQAKQRYIILEEFKR